MLGFAPDQGGILAPALYTKYAAAGSPTRMALNGCCVNCGVKESTLGSLGWLPNGFSSAPALGTLSAVDPAQVRVVSAVGIGLSGLIAAAGVGLWKKGKHPIIGGLLFLWGGSGLAIGVSQLVSGKNFMEA